MSWDPCLIEVKLFVDSIQHNPCFYGCGAMPGETVTVGPGHFHSFKPAQHTLSVFQEYEMESKKFLPVTRLICSLKCLYRLIKEAPIVEN